MDATKCPICGSEDTYIYEVNDEEAWKGRIYVECNCRECDGFYVNTYTLTRQGVDE